MTPADLYFRRKKWQAIPNPLAPEPVFSFDPPPPAAPRSQFEEEEVAEEVEEEREEAEEDEGKEPETPVGAAAGDAAESSKKAPGNPIPNLRQENVNERIENGELLTMLQKGYPLSRGQQTEGPEKLPETAVKADDAMLMLTTEKDQEKPPQHWMWKNYQTKADMIGGPGGGAGGVGGGGVGGGGGGGPGVGGGGGGVDERKTSKGPVVTMSKWQRMELYVRYPSLRVVFTLISVMTLMVTVGAMILFTVLRGESLESTLAKTMSSSASQRTSFYLTEVLDGSLMVALEGSRFVAPNTSVLSRPDITTRGLYSLLKHSPPNVDVLFLGDRLGRYASVARSASLDYDLISFSTVVNPMPGDLNRVEYVGNRDCNPNNMSCSILQGEPTRYFDFDPRTRPWYQESLLNPGSLWTPLYTFAATGEIGLTGVDPHFNEDSELFVVGVGITIRSLGMLLRDLISELDSPHLVYIVSEENELLACGTGKEETAEDGHPITLDCEHLDGFNLTFNSTIKTIRDTSAIIHVPTILTSTAIQYFEELGQYFVATRLYYNSGITWVIVVVLDESELSESFTLVAVVAPVVGVVLLIISIILVYYLTKRITGPLKQVTKKLSAISNLELDSSTRFTEDGSHIREVNEIEDATMTLVFGLRSFSKYVPQDIVKLLVKTQREATLGLVEIDSSIFFSDIANFSSISDCLSTRELVALLGEYLMEMSEIIQQNGGLVDKYIGDSVMAFWNAPNQTPKHELAACDAALQSQTVLKQLRETWLSNGFPRVESRIGLNAGRVRVGNIGSSTRFNYTCIGDNVNLASRLEGLNKIYGTQIIVSGGMHDKVKDVMLTRLLDVVTVKGKSKAVRIYELVGKRETCSIKEEEACRLFKRAFEWYLRRDFEESIRLFNSYLKMYDPESKAAKTHIKNCRDFIAKPPPVSWDGIARVEQK